MHRIRVTQAGTNTPTTHILFTTNHEAFGPDDVDAVKAVLKDERRVAVRLTNGGKELWVDHPTSGDSWQSLAVTRMFIRRYPEAELHTYHTGTKRLLGGLVTQVTS